MQNQNLQLQRKIAFSSKLKDFKTIWKSYKNVADNKNIKCVQKYNTKLLIWEADTRSMNFIKRVSWLECWVNLRSQIVFFRAYIHLLSFSVSFCWRFNFHSLSLHSGMSQYFFEFFELKTTYLWEATRTYENVKEERKITLKTIQCRTSKKHVDRWKERSFKSFHLLASKLTCWIRIGGRIEVSLCSATKKERKIEEITYKKKDRLKHFIKLERKTEI